MVCLIQNTLPPVLAHRGRQPVHVRHDLDGDRHIGGGDLLHQKAILQVDNDQRGLARIQVLVDVQLAAALQHAVDGPLRNLESCMLPTPDKDRYYIKDKPATGSTKMHKDSPRGSQRGRGVQFPRRNRNQRDTHEHPEDDLERELDMLMAKAGAQVPAERKAGIVAGYRAQAHGGSAASAQNRCRRDFEYLQLEELHAEQVIAEPIIMSMTTPLHELSIAEVGRQLRAGALSSTILTQHALSRIASLDPLLHAFVLVTRERALADAARADREIKSGIDKGPMHGIPYAQKDIYATAGIRTTCHSKLLIDNIPAEDCVVEAKFRAGGAVLLGKLATHEFALGGPSFDLPFPPARNPWNLDHFTGGSSSGSGSAVAAGLVRVAMGSDTGGSIRGPAFYCGTVGLKPTYGLVRRGAASSLSLLYARPLRPTHLDGGGYRPRHAGIAGHDPLDPASADIPARRLHAAGSRPDLQG